MAEHLDPTPHLDEACFQSFDEIALFDAPHAFEFDFVADNPGKTLFQRRQQLPMDFGLMAMFDYA